MFALSAIGLVLLLTLYGLTRVFLDYGWQGVKDFWNTPETFFDDKRKEELLADVKATLAEIKA